MADTQTTLLNEAEQQIVDALTAAGNGFTQADNDLDQRLGGHIITLSNALAEGRMNDAHDAMAAIRQSMNGHGEGLAKVLESVNKFPGFIAEDAARKMAPATADLNTIVNDTEPTSTAFPPYEQASASLALAKQHATEILRHVVGSEKTTQNTLDLIQAMIDGFHAAEQNLADVPENYEGGQDEQRTIIHAAIEEIRADVGNFMEHINKQLTDVPLNGLDSGAWSQHLDDAQNALTQMPTAGANPSILDSKEAADRYFDTVGKFQTEHLAFNFKAPDEQRDATRELRTALTDVRIHTSSYLSGIRTNIDNLLPEGIAKRRNDVIQALQRTANALENVDADLVTKTIELLLPITALPQFENAFYMPQHTENEPSLIDEDTLVAASTAALEENALLNPENFKKNVKDKELMVIIFGDIAIKDKDGLNALREEAAQRQATLLAEATNQSIEDARAHVDAGNGMPKDSNVPGFDSIMFDLAKEQDIRIDSFYDKDLLILARDIQAAGRIYYMTTNALSPDDVPELRIFPDSSDVQKAYVDIRAHYAENNDTIRADHTIADVLSTAIEQTREKQPTAHEKLIEFYKKVEADTPPDTELEKLIAETHGIAKHAFDTTNDILTQFVEHNIENAAEAEELRQYLGDNVQYVSQAINHAQHLDETDPDAVSTYRKNFHRTLSTVYGGLYNRLKTQQQTFQGLPQPTRQKLQADLAVSKDALKAALDQRDAFLHAQTNRIGVFDDIKPGLSGLAATILKDGRRADAIADSIIDEMSTKFGIYSIHQGISAAIAAPRKRDRVISKKGRASYATTKNLVEEHNKLVQKREIAAIEESIAAVAALDIDVTYAPTQQPPIHYTVPGADGRNMTVDLTALNALVAAKVKANAQEDAPVPPHPLFAALRNATGAMVATFQTASFVSEEDGRDITENILLMDQIEAELAKETPNFTHIKTLTVSILGTAVILENLDDVDQDAVIEMNQAVSKAHAELTHYMTPQKGPEESPEHTDTQDVPEQTAATDIDYIATLHAYAAYAGRATDAALRTLGHTDIADAMKRDFRHIQEEIAAGKTLETSDTEAVRNHRFSLNGKINAIFKDGHTALRNARESDAYEQNPEWRPSVDNALGHCANLVAVRNDYITDLAHQTGIFNNMRPALEAFVTKKTGTRKADAPYVVDSMENALHPYLGFFEITESIQLGLDNSNRYSLFMREEAVKKSYKSLLTLAKTHATLDALSENIKHAQKTLESIENQSSRKASRLSKKIDGYRARTEKEKRVAHAALGTLFNVGKELRIQREEKFEASMRVMERELGEVLEQNLAAEQSAPPLSSDTSRDGSKYLLGDSGLGTPNAPVLKYLNDVYVQMQDQLRDMDRNTPLHEQMNAIHNLIRGVATPKPRIMSAEDKEKIVRGGLAALDDTGFFENADPKIREDILALPAFNPEKLGNRGSQTEPERPEPILNGNAAFVGIRHTTSQESPKAKPSHTDQPTAEDTGTQRTESNATEGTEGTLSDRLRKQFGRFAKRFTKPSQQRSESVRVEPHLSADTAHQRPSHDTDEIHATDHHDHDDTANQQNGNHAAAHEETISDERLSMFEAYNQDALAQVQAGAMNEFRSIKDPNAFLMLNAVRNLEEDPNTVDALLHRAKEVMRAQLLQQGGISEAKVNDALNALGNNAIWNAYAQNPAYDQEKLAIVQQTHALFSGLKHDLPHAINEVKIDDLHVTYRDRNDQEYISDGEMVKMKSPNDGDATAAKHWDNLVTTYMFEHNLTANSPEKEIEFSLHMNKGVESEQFKLGALQILKHCYEKGKDVDIALNPEEGTDKNIIRELNIGKDDPAFLQMVTFIENERADKGIQAAEPAEVLLRRLINNHNDKYKPIRVKNDASSTPHGKFSRMADPDADDSIATTEQISSKTKRSQRYTSLKK